MTSLRTNRSSSHALLLGATVAGCLVLLPAGMAQAGGNCQHGPVDGETCREFCVGPGVPGCFTAGEPWVIANTSEAPDELHFTFSALIDIDFPIGSSVTLLKGESTTEPTEAVFSIVARRLSAQPADLFLIYRMSPGLYGTLYLGAVEDQTFENWEVHRLASSPSRFRIFRDTDIYSTGLVPLSGSSDTIHQGALNQSGSPSGSIAQWMGAVE